MSGITRRQVLLGIGGFTGLAIVGDLEALAKTGRPKLYVLDDYVNPHKEPSQFRTVYLDTLPGISVVHVWGTWCDPCIEELPAYNQLFSRYQQRNGVSFVSALLEGALFTMNPLAISPEQAVAMCIDGSMIDKHPFGSPEYKSMEKALQSHPYGPELTKILKECNEQTRRAYAQGSHPEKREKAGERLAQFKAQGKWTNCPTYVLDDDDTDDFLRGKNPSGVPYTTFLVNGRYYATVSGAGKVKVVEHVLKTLLSMHE